MDSKHISQGIINALFKIGLITSGIFLLIELKILLIYIVVAAIITLIGRPIVLFLKKKLKLSNLLAASFSLFILGSIIFGIISLFIPLIIQQSENSVKLRRMTLNEIPRAATRIEVISSETSKKYEKK